MNRDHLWVLLTLAGFALFCIGTHARRVPVELAIELENRLAAADLSSAQVQFHGRDLTLVGTAPDQQSRRDAGELAAGVWGVRNVDNQITVSVAAAPSRAAVREAVQDQVDAVLSSGVIEFETGRDRLTRSGAATVERIGAVLARSPETRARIEGHTDSEGAAAFNGGLSRRRAQAVLRALVRSGVPKSRLQADGFGETRPIADNATAAGRLRNRRVEIAIE